MMSPGVRELIRGKFNPETILKAILGKPKHGTLPNIEYVALVTDKMLDTKGEQLPGTWIMVAFRLPDTEAKT